MDILDNLYMLSVKNKHFFPHAALLVIGMIAGRELANKEEDKEYLGDNLPLDLTDRINSI